MNKKHNINLEFSETEKILYTYSQGVTLKILEELTKKYEETSNIATADPFQENSEDLLDEMPTLTRT